MLEGSLGALVTLELASRRAVGLDAVSYFSVPVVASSVVVLYLPVMVVKPAAVPYRPLEQVGTL
jgi:hypothetical protein